MSAYEALAGCYDELTYDIRYEKTLTFFERLCAREQVQPHLVLDLACGTGSLSMLLAGRGYRVIGADLSEDMLAEAAAKQVSDGKIQPIYLQQSMDELDLYGTVEAAVCCLDSLNFLPDVRALRRTLRRLHLFVAPGGVFIFDINTPEKLRALDGQIFLDEREDVYCVWRTSYERRSRLCVYGMDLFQREENLAPLQ